MVLALEMVRVKDSERASDSARVSAQTAEPDQALALEVAMK